MDLVDIDKVLDDLELNESTTSTSELLNVVSNNYCPTTTITTIPTTNPNTSQTAAAINNAKNISLEYNNEKISCDDVVVKTTVTATTTTTTSNDETDYNNYPNLQQNLSNYSEQLQLQQQQQQQQNQINESLIKNSLLDNISNISSLNTKNPTIIIDDDRIKNKKFVTVSNVFSSLDDYRRDVESLQENNKQHDNFVGNNSLKGNDDDDDDDDAFVDNVVKLTDKKIFKNDDNININNKNLIDEFDRNDDKFINKKTELITKQNNDDDDNTEDEPEETGCTTASTNSSITTSSPSSFSSGPSPGSPGSESCSFVLGQDHNKLPSYQNQKTISAANDCDDDVVNAKETISKESGNNLRIENKSKSSNDNSTFDIQQQRQQQMENDGNNKESTELGLSSISSYLYCENVSSSLPCSSQDMKFDAFSSTSSQTQNMMDKENDNFEIFKTNENLDVKHQRPFTDGDDNATQNKSPQKQKVIGFGSTMDEISDTELDSILQEIDNDFQMYYVPPAVATNGGGGVNSSGTGVDKSTTLTTSKVQQSLKSSIPIMAEEEDSLDHVEKVKATLAKSENDDLPGEGVSSSQQYPQTPVEDENNLQNADSFSQASTIEFADLRLQTDFDVDINEEKSSNATAGNSDQTVESAVSSESEVSLKNSKNLNDDTATATATKEHKQSKSESNNNKNADDNMNSDKIKEDQLQAEPVTRLQRPNSLDLPSQMDVKMYINSTAGQTPPASRLDDISLLSTSSSDDQQLSSSEQHRMPSSSNQIDEHRQSENQNDNSVMASKQQLGKIPPFWIPDNEAPACMHCKQKFSLIKRRHHCRACGQVLCSVCCSQKAKLSFLGNTEARVCTVCCVLLNEMKTNEGNNTILSSDDNRLSNSVVPTNDNNTSDSAGGSGISSAAAAAQPHRSPNPNNPMEYCSMISPYQQVGQQAPSSPISVMVPVGVLKREGAPKNTRKDKNVIFSDGIRPGCDLTELDNSWGTITSNKTKTDNNEFASGVGNSGSSSGGSRSKLEQQQHIQGSKKLQTSSAKTNQRNINRNIKSTIYDETESYIPKEVNNLPPICVSNKTEIEFKDIPNNAQLIERLQNETLKFAISRNFFVYVKIVKLKCCVNKTIINFTTQGMHHVGQDEIVILLEFDNSDKIPKDIFVHLNEIYKDADHGYPISELGFSMPKETNFLGSREHGGFLYIRSSFQCLQEIYLPESPFLIGILIHRWEVPWAKIFPLRLMLRLGAEYRYYPSPHISIRGRNSVYAEIAQTIINFLADFRNYSYTLATIRGMYIHMEDRRTNILIPKNRYDQIVKALNNSSDHILALGGNFSQKADGHLVCIQNMEADCPETHTYSTQAINIQGQARKVTGASFIVFNGALKTTSGLTGKCNIVEDGLMVQILPAKMQDVRNSLKNMKDIDIVCGPNDVDESQTEIVSIKWTENDTDFNIGVKSPIDGKRMDGIPSIRVHLGLNYSNKNHIIRWTEVFIIQYDEDSVRSKDPIDISKISEQVAKSTSIALVSFLDLLAANECLKIGLRATLHQENVCYEAGSKGSKLPPLYMNALDNELIPILHKQATALDVDTPVILELIFHILNK